MSEQAELIPLSPKENVIVVRKVLSEELASRQRMCDRYPAALEHWQSRCAEIQRALDALDAVEKALEVP